MNAWRAVCEAADILPDTGVCAEVDGKQVAVFRVDEAVYALDNRDPASDANVLSRGIVGDLGGEIVVASPIYKHHFSLATGRCLEEPDYSINTYPARVVDGKIWIRPQARRRDRAAGKRRLVVIGNGMAGMRTVEELLKVAPALYDIEIFGAEPHGNYNRVLLSPLLAGEKHADEIMLHPLEWYREQGVTLHTADPAVAIDRVRRRVTSQKGVEVSYDRLLLATGSNPVILPVPGRDLSGVVTFRDLEDVNRMLEAARTHTRAIVIGGGLLGLEAANGLLCQGMDVTVVHLQEYLMERQLDRAAAELLKRALEQRGIKFKMPASTSAILGTAPASEDARGQSDTPGHGDTRGGDDIRAASDAAGSELRAGGRARVTGVRFSDGSELPAELVVMAAGIRPNITLAQLASLRCERGVLVDDTMLTYDPCIYAVGECVQHRHSTYGLVAPLWEQARVCAGHLAEIGLARFPGSLPIAQLKVAGIQVFSAGDLQDTARSESLVFRDAKRGIYKRLVLEDDRVRGAVLYGDTSDGPWYVELMTEARRIGALREKLLFGAVLAGSA
ncbi:MAG: nitrite reductase small subunit NirD [Pseudomonadota bacterium]|nr:nitrite reductase small subunit NirD [Pseudomonadota bacterium]